MLNKIIISIIVMINIVQTKEDNLNIIKYIDKI